MPVNSAMVPPERTHDNYENWALYLSLFRCSVMVLPYPPPLWIPAFAGMTRGWGWVG